MPFDDECAPIVSAIRIKHGIEPPRNREELRFNLRHYPPHSLENQVLEALVEVADRLFFPNLNQLPDMPTQESEENIPDLPPEIETIIENQLSNFMLEAFGRSLARYIVVGPMELPQPLYANFTGGVFTIPIAGLQFVFALANQFSKPKILAHQFIKECDRAFKHPVAPLRDRIPDELALQAWAWATYESLNIENESDRYATIAEIYCEAFPNKKQGVGGCAFCHGNAACFRGWQSRFLRHGRDKRAIHLCRLA